MIIHPGNVGRNELERQNPVKSASADAKLGSTFRSREAAAINLWLAILLVATTGCASTSDAANSARESGVHCSDAWYQSIDEKVPTGDGRGHGPDVGSDEWKSVVEFKLGIRGKPDIPGRDSQAWCRHIDQVVEVNRRLSSGNAGREARVTGPSFACDKVKHGSIEAMICDEEALAALDRKLAGVYSAASEKAVNQHPPLLKAEQRGWIKGRNECWKAADLRECVKNEYERRIAELQARYRLVPDSGPVRFICDDNPANEVVATFFRTDPATMIAERGDSVSLMYLEPSASGSKYQGRNETFWEHQGQAMITWGHGAPEMRCRRTP